MGRAFQGREHVNILLVSQYFWPETFIINDLDKTLAAQGHQVQVFTGKPTYPRGRHFRVTRRMAAIGNCMLSRYPSIGFHYGSVGAAPMGWC